VDELEERIRDPVQPRLDRAALVHAEMQQPSAEDERDHEHLQQFAARERADEVLREDVEDEPERGMRLARWQRRLGTGGRGRGGAHALSDAEQVPTQKSER
jgi:hypothetical protein